MSKPLLLLFLVLAACSRAPVVQGAPVATPLVVRTIVDRSAVPCTVSFDGFVWYRVPAGVFPPIDVRHAKCGRANLSRTPIPPRPRWAIPSGPTQTRFVATSLQQAVSIDGMRSLERTAASHHVPMSWMVGHMHYLRYVADYDAYHAANGDDVQAEYYTSLHDAMKAKFPWYVPKVSILTAGIERDLPRALSFGEHAFWGITWNSRGTDLTYDYGAPWGTYCADLTSYKRPQPDGGCAMLAFEWTARDLTRAYLSGDEASFSTDPDDLRRAGFSAHAAAEYMRRLADAYAAAGETQPIVMTVQQETNDELNPADPPMLDALFDQAVRDGMHLETLAQAADDARTFSAAPRAVAFPFIPGGPSRPSAVLGGDTLYPATIDYHDARAGMTFLSGHTLPSRLFRYADDPVSRFDAPLPEVPGRDMPVLTGAWVADGWLVLALRAPRAERFGAAIWSDPARLRLEGPGIIPAGRAGVVLAFDLKKGANRVRYRCPGCRRTTFDYSF